MFSDDYYDWTKLDGMELEELRKSQISVKESKKMNASPVSKNAQESFTVDDLLDVIQAQRSDIARLQNQLDAWRRAASPVTDNPTEDAETSILSGPTEAGCYHADGTDGRKLLLADTNKATGEWMVYLPESIHDWPKWFVPDWSVWKDWKSV